MHHYYFPQCHTCQAPWHLRELARVLRDAGVQAIAVSKDKLAESHFTTFTTRIKPDGRRKRRVKKPKGRIFSTLYVLNGDGWAYTFLEALVRAQAGSLKPGQISMRHWRRLRARFVDHVRRSTETARAAHTAFMTGGEAAVFALFGVPVEGSGVTCLT